MANKFQQGGQVKSSNKEQDAVMQFVKALAQTLQADPQQIVQAAQENPEALKSAVQVYQDSKGDIQKAAQAFSQALQSKAQAAKHGAKLNYLKSLKNQCAEDEELYYYKKGGSVGCGCKKKEQGGELKEKKESIVNKFKMSSGGQTPKKKQIDQATKDSIEVNKYDNQEIMSSKPGKLVNNPKFNKKDPNSRAQIWVPDRTKTPYKKEDKVKKDCSGSKMKLKKGDKVKSAGAGCIAKFKRYSQGGSLIRKYQNAGTITAITPTGSIITPELVDWNRFNDNTQKYVIKNPGFGYTPKFYTPTTVQNTKFQETPEFDPNAGYDEAYNRYKQDLWSSGKRINPRKAEKRFKEQWAADVENRRNRFNQQANQFANQGATKLDQLIKQNQQWRKDNALISNFRRDMEKIQMEADKDVNDFISQNNHPVQTPPVQGVNNNYWLSKAKPYGFKTIDEVKAWQEANGLTPDGKMGSLSIAKYNELNQSNNSSNPEDYTVLSQPVTAIVNATGNFLRNGTPEEEVSWKDYPLTWAITKLGQHLRK